jgi:hypothetical protein
MPINTSVDIHIPPGAVEKVTALSDCHHAHQNSFIAKW